MDKKAPTTQPDTANENNRDTEVLPDAEEDSLYNDGLNLDKDAGELAGTRGDTPGIAKP